MELKTFLWAVFISGAVYLVTSTILTYISGLIVPVDLLSIPGSRQYNDPMMVGYFLYGFVLAFGAVLLYNLIKLKGKVVHKGILFGALMWIAVTISSGFMIFSTMNYSEGFYLNQVVFGLVNWVLMGIVIAWAVETK
jgi:hypothetical protein